MQFLKGWKVFGKEILSIFSAQLLSRLSTFMRMIRIEINCSGFLGMRKPQILKGLLLVLQLELLQLFFAYLWTRYVVIYDTLILVAWFVAYFCSQAYFVISLVFIFCCIVLILARICLFPIIFVLTNSFFWGVVFLLCSHNHFGKVTYVWGDIHVNETEHKHRIYLLLWICYWFLAGNIMLS